MMVEYVSFTGAAGSTVAESEVVTFICHSKVLSLTCMFPARWREALAHTHTQTHRHKERERINSCAE